MSVDDFNALGHEWQCLILKEYGIAATVWQKQGRNKTNLMREAREELHKADMLFGFYMDRPQNAIGSTGWDCIKGDTTGGYRHKSAVE